MGIPCFLIEPIYGDPLPPSHDEWPPHRYITAWKRQGTNDIRTYKHEFEPGAMWFAVWIPINWTWDNEIGPHLHVRCPNGANETRDWDIDSRCNNCGLPSDRTHRCWVRHGIPPMITVDKQGLTCPAGAGSIRLPNWHGFLRQGELVT